MKKAIKKLCIAVLALCLCTSMAVIAGCGGTNVNISLNTEILKLTPQMQYTLVATVEGSTNEIEWSSSNTEVVTVENGVVSAIKVGEAVITAKVAGKSATCNVSVETDSNNAYFPILLLSQYDATIRVGDSVIVTPNVSFMGQNVIAEQLSYSSSNDEKVSITKNINNQIIITGLQFTEGTPVNVFIRASYNGYTLERTIEVSVVEEITIVMKKEIEIYTYSNQALNEQGIYDSQNIFTSGVLNGQEIDASALTWESEDEEIATVENGLVKGHSQGVTSVKASYVLNGQTFFETCRVIVDLTKITIDKEPQKLYKIETDGSAIIDTGYYGIKDNNIEFNFSDITDNNNIKSLDVKTVVDGKYSMNNADLLGGVRKIKASTNKVEYVIEVIVYSKIIKTADEFIALRTYGGVESSSTNFTFGGYYALGNNIDLSGKEIGVPFVQSSDVSVRALEGFVGIFDGCGYTINGGTYYASIFGSLGKDAVVKNLAIINATLKIDHEKANTKVNIVSAFTYGTLQDVLIDYYVVGNANTNGVYWVSAFGEMYNPKVENVVVYGNTVEPITGGAYALTFAETIWGATVTKDAGGYPAGSVRGDIEVNNVWSFGGFCNGVYGQETGANSYAHTYLCSSVFINQITGHVFSDGTSVSTAMADAEGFGNIWDLSGNIADKPLFVSSAEFFD